MSHILEHNLFMPGLEIWHLERWVNLQYLTNNEMIKLINKINNQGAYSTQHCSLNSDMNSFNPKLKANLPGSFRIHRSKASYTKCVNHDWQVWNTGPVPAHIIARTWCEGSVLLLSLFTTGLYVRFLFCFFSFRMDIRILSPAMSCHLKCVNVFLMDLPKGGTHHGKVQVLGTMLIMSFSSRSLQTNWWPWVCSVSILTWPPSINWCRTGRPCTTPWR